MGAEWEWVAAASVPACGSADDDDDGSCETSDSEDDDLSEDTEVRCVEVSAPDDGLCKPYACPKLGCGRAFVTAGDLAAHVRTGHYAFKKAGRAKMTFVCPHPGCGKALRDNLSLVRHTRVHTGERPYACAQCGAAFKLKRHMQVHVQRKHTCEKPFACTHPGCARTFVSRGELDVHTRGHTGEKPYVCRVPGCAKAFATSGERHRHECRKVCGARARARVEGVCRILSVSAF